MNRFLPLEQDAYRSLEQASYLKGLLKPFKGKGSLETWAKQCVALRDDLIALGERRVLAQARGHPFDLFDIQLAQQKTGAGTTFLRWRSLDHSRTGVALWEELIARPATPLNLLADLLAMEEQRITLNMQIGLTHAIARQAGACAHKMARAEGVYLRRLEAARWA
jgi:hypothetical protein